jgi:hypothetical protein
MAPDDCCTDDPECNDEQHPMESLHPAPVPGRISVSPHCPFEKSQRLDNEQHYGKEEPKWRHGVQRCA